MGIRHYGKVLFLVGLDRETPSGSEISLVALVEQGGKDPLGQTGKEKGRASLNLKETAQTFATWLQQIKEDQHKVAPVQGLEANMGEGLPLVPQKLVERVQKGSSSRCMNYCKNSG